ncbi:hypothetical protein C8Q74DRAFT_424422 [Fomes fomentarius]|nr:hypothetical protein C8Q74DRAFT_424422 [Fomes fomentarius]
MWVPARRVPGSSCADEYEEDGFISLFIDLPSEYTGGALSVSYDGLTQRFDTSATSALQTTVTGCLYAARHSMDRIKNGFRFVVEYRMPVIVQTPTKLNRVPVRDLRRILRSWKRMPADSAPQKIIFLLDRRRKDQDKELRLLLGSDARKVGLLRTVGKGFHLGIADLAYVEKGVGVQPDSVEPCTAGKVEMKEVLETALSLETLFELDRPGKVLRETLDVEASTELISTDLPSVFHSKAPAYQNLS